ncbi:MAG: PQQ-binding-like beta-propeller repeat protein [Phycisphaerae bacterium]|jgi:outer membrane protein assembly factor BamB
MRVDLITVLCTFAVAPIAAADESTDNSALNWSQWRGPMMTGVAPHGDPPVEWGESKNVRWKVAVPGHGHATPIVWEDRIYIQTAIKTDREVETAGTGQPPDEPRDRRGRGGPGRMPIATPTHVHRFVLLALDRRTGKTLWQKTLREELPHEGGHQDASQASNSPVTDGRRLVAYFGSRGLYCLDMNGELIWQKDLGDMQTRRSFGEGSSPVLFGDTVVVNWDHEGQSFVVALDLKTGDQKWKVDRDEPTSWATPLVVDTPQGPQVVTSATNKIRSYDLATGELRWHCGGMTLNVIPSPLEADGLLYVASGFRGNALMAVRYAGAKGDITDSEFIAWKYGGKGTPYVPSMVLYDGHLYLLDGNRPVLSCIDAKTGELRYTKQRLEGLQGVFASPVAANGRLYIPGRGGKTAIVQTGPEFKPLATNTLDDGFASSPVIVGRELILRGHQHLYSIAHD